MGVVLICVASGTWASTMAPADSGNTFIYQTMPKESQYVFFVGNNAPVMHANSGQASPHPGANLSSAGAEAPEGGEDRPFPGALFATLLALIGVVTVARRGMSK